MRAETCRKEQFESFARGLSLLRHALERSTETFSPLEKEGAVRRFEYCLEVGWKAAREFLEDSGLRIAPVTPREVIRQAAAAGIVANAEVWIEMFNHRNLLAHNYDGVVIGEVTNALPGRYFPALEELHDFLAGYPSPQLGSTVSL
jgi:nucleotidyltransferase substrate binding protein (TIGR01987 family)